MSESFFSYRRIVVSQVREGEPGRAIQDSREAIRVVHKLLRDSVVEQIWAIMLDSKHVPIGVYQVSIGTVSSAPAHPREIYGPAMLSMASAIVLVHNHPSGSSIPSPEDRRLTDRMCEVGEILGVPLLDHVVLGHSTYYSFASETTLPIPA